MVWGMSLPSGFGEFWPSGWFEGYSNEPGNWGDRLKSYYLDSSPDDQKALYDHVDTGFRRTASWYASYAAGKFVHEMGTKDGPDKPPFGPILSHEPPRSFEIERGGKSLGSLIMLVSRTLAVDEALKVIIEQLEPGAHQFFPIKIRRRNGEEYPKPYFVIVIGQYFDSFSRENSKEGSFRDYGPEYPESYKPPRYDATIKGLAFSKAEFGSAHLWRDRSFREWLNCFSDELIAEIAKAGLRIPKHYHMMEV